LKQQRLLRNPLCAKGAEGRTEEFSVFRYFGLTQIPPMTVGEVCFFEAFAALCGYSDCGTQ